MKGSFLKKGNKNQRPRDIFANKSAVVLDWILLKGSRRPQFAMRDVAGENPVSLGLVHAVFEQLIDQGFLSVSGVRTSKTFAVRDPRGLLELWRTRYKIVEKCRIRTYRSVLSGRRAVLSALGHSKYWKDAALALHTAADALGYGFSNLDTTELYVVDPRRREKLEEFLQLEQQDRGHDVLLIEPFYKDLLSTNSDFENQGARLISPKEGGQLFSSPPLLTYLDLFHYPIRGEEQAEALAERNEDVRRILTWRSK